MTERERLIKLINEAKKADTEDVSFSEFLADFLLANGVLVPPCKVGDTAYEVINSTIRESVVVALLIAQDGTIGVRTDYCYPITREIGRMLYLTREEAEAKLWEANNG